MNKLYYGLLCMLIVLTTACSDQDNLNIKNKGKLGMIFPKSNSKLILFENGVLAKPVSGIADFDNRKIGSKLLLNYRNLGVTDGITNIEVLNFAEANDSIFVSEQDESGFLTAIYSTSFSGTFYTADADSTFFHHGQVHFSFGESEFAYTIDSETEEVVSGTGNFSISGNRISFTNNTQDILLPNMNFYFSVYEDYLWLWLVLENGDFYSYALKKE